MEHFHRVIATIQLKTSYKLATALQLNNVGFLVLLSKSTCRLLSNCAKVSSSKLIGNFVAKSVCKFVCVRKFIIAPTFDQNVCSSYRVVKT